MRWNTNSFTSLSLDALYATLRLRQEVFIVEQGIRVLDADGQDLIALHVTGEDTRGQLVAYARILPPDSAYPEPSIGRVCVHGAHRTKGLGKALMLEAIKACRQYHPKHPIKVSAQHYLKTFYESLGFKTISDVYQEAGIPHIAMRLDYE